MNLYKNTFIISLFTILSQALGVLRDKLLISVVGVGITLDIYNAAFKIPDIVMAIIIPFAGITVIVPLLTASIIKNNQEELYKKLSTLFVFFNLTMAFFCILVTLTLDLFLYKIFPNFSASDLITLSGLIKIMLLQPILLGASGLLSCIALAYKNFLCYAIAPVFYNIGIIIGVIFFYKSYGVNGLIYGALLGAFMHISINSYFIFKNKVDLNIFSFDFKYIKEIFPIASWRSIAFIMIALKQFIITIFSGFLGAGIISIWTFALNLTNMCVQFFASSYAIASFPLLSEQYERGEYETLRNTIKKQSRNIFLFSIMFSIMAFIFAKLFVNIIYNGNKDVLNIFYVLILSIPFLNLEQYYARAMMAAHKVKLISVIHIFSFIVLLLCLAIFYKMGYSYLFLAYSYLISTIFQVMILYFIGNNTIIKNKI